MSIFDSMTDVDPLADPDLTRTGMNRAGGHASGATPESIRSADRKIQSAMVDIKKKFGKNAIFKSADLQDCATQLERNEQIGGHKSGKKE